MKSSMVRAFTRRVGEASKFVAKNGVKTLAAAMHTSRETAVDVSTFSSMGDALKNDPVASYLRTELAKQNLDVVRRDSLNLQLRKRTNNIMKAWAAWAALGKQEGGHELYRSMQQYYKDMYAAVRAALNTNIRGIPKLSKERQDQIIDAATVDKQKDPEYPDVPPALFPNVYFPFKRYGKYWLSVSEKAKKDGKREFHQFSSAWERDRFQERRARQLGLSDKVKNNEYFRTGNDVASLQKHFHETSTMLNRMFEVIDGAKLEVADNDEGNAALQGKLDRLKDELYQTYLMTMPERSIRKQFLHAEGVPGYTEDVLRNFKTTASAYANQLPKLKYGRLLDRKVEEARGRIKEWPDDVQATLNTVIDTLAHNAFTALNPPDQSKVVTFLNNSAFLFLLSSAATAMVQTTSVPMRVLPHFVAKYGYINTFKMLAKYSQVWGTVGVTEARPDGTIESTAPTFVNAKLQGMEKRDDGFDIAKASRDMQARDAFEENSVHAMLDNRATDTGPAAQGVRRVTSIAMKALTVSFSMAERMSREMTGLMAYELEFNKLKGEGLSPEARHYKAVSNAVASIHSTLGNYSAFERPAYLKSDLARFAMLFKMYAINTSMFFYKNSTTIMSRDATISAKERVEAAHEIAGVLLMSAVFSGVTGMPLYSLITTLIDWLNKDDDDPETIAARMADPLAANDADWNFRTKWLPQHFGSITIPGLGKDPVPLSEVIERGPVSALSGVNLASRTAYNDMWWRKGREGKNWAETVQNYLFDNFSPGLSTGFNLIGAAEDWSNGDIIRGFEKMSPALVKGGFTATRLALEGSKTRGGDLMLSPDEIEEFPLLMQVAGFQPTAVRRAQDVRIGRKDRNRRVETERNNILQRLNRGRYEDDTSQMGRALEEIDEFNKRYPVPEAAITPEVMADSWDQFVRIKLGTIRGTDYNDRMAPYY